VIRLYAQAPGRIHACAAGLSGAGVILDEGNPLTQSTALGELDRIAGSANVTYDTGFLRHHGWQGELPKACVTPADEEQLCEVMRLAHAKKWKVFPAGNGTKLRMTRACDADIVVSLKLFSGITEYQPADLTVTVGAGTPVSVVNAALAEHGQMLPLDAPFTATGATIGGVMATHSSGPRRHAYGSVRDIAIGARFVIADGMLAKSGGKVVKNVAGYDAVKLLIGSYGTIGIITSATFKVFPIPPASATVVMGFSSMQSAMNARDRVINSPLTLQALDLLDSSAAEMMGQGSAVKAPYSLIAEVAGPQRMVDRVCRDLPELVRPDLTSVAELTGGAAQELWSPIQESTPGAIAAFPDGIALKASVVLSRVGDVIACADEVTAANGLNLATVARAGVGIVYFYFWPRHTNSDAEQSLSDASNQIISTVRQYGGWATVEYAPAKLKARVASSTKPDASGMMQRIRRQLDPDGIFAGSV
jgi:glycolate oxidase FAD binding subunit